MSLYNTQKNDNSQSNAVLFWKHPGETLAVMLRRFRDEHNLSPDEKITYAGRLDPMAEGIVPLLVGEARFQKDHLLGANKTYEVEIALGISTDTGDMLGLTSSNLVLSTSKDISPNPGLIEIQRAVTTLSEITELSYPNYSSRPVEGKPLFMHARAGKKVPLPIKKVTIHNLELVTVEEKEIRAVVEESIAIIKKVQGDFRQEEIIAQWNSFVDTIAQNNGTSIMQIVTIRTTVSSGTYMRSLAEKMGELLGIPALALKIKRTAVEHQQK